MSIEGGGRREEESAFHERAPPSPSQKRAPRGRYVKVPRLVQSTGAVVALLPRIAHVARLIAMRRLLRIRASLCLRTKRRWIRQMIKQPPVVLRIISALCAVPTKVHKCAQMIGADIRAVDDGAFGRIDRVIAVDGGGG